MPIFKKTKCSMKWCYSPSRHKDGTCDKICTYNTIHVQTNGDRIRAMTDEGLAEKWWAWIDCGECPARPNCSMLHKDCKQFALDWLKKEVDDG